MLDGETGLLVPDDPRAFTAALRTVLLDQHLSRRLGAAAQVRARQFTWAQTAQAFAVVLHRAAEGLPPISAVDPVGTGSKGDLGVEIIEVKSVRLDGR